MPLKHNPAFETVEAIRVKRPRKELTHEEFKEILGEYTKIKLDKKIEDINLAIRHAAKLGNLEVIKDLFEYYATLSTQKASIYSTDANDYNALHLAVEGGHEEVVRWLLNLDAKGKGTTGIIRLSASQYIHYSTKNGQTPIHLAAQNNHPNIMKLLSDLGADCEATDESGYSAIHIAASEGQQEAIKWMATNGINLYKITEGGRNALHAAARNGKTEAMEWLSNHGFDINAATNSGSTALYLAVNSKNIDSVKYLLGQGADINLLTNNGGSALSIAAYLNLLEITELLIETTYNLRISEHKAEAITPKQKIDIINKIIEDLTQYKLTTEMKVMIDRVSTNIKKNAEAPINADGANEQAGEEEATTNGDTPGDAPDSGSSSSASQHGMSQASINQEEQTVDDDIEYTIQTQEEDPKETLYISNPLEAEYKARLDTYIDLKASQELINMAINKLEDIIKTCANHFFHSIKLIYVSSVKDLTEESKAEQKQKHGEGKYQQETSSVKVKEEESSIDQQYLQKTTKNSTETPEYGDLGTSPFMTLNSLEGFTPALEASNSGMELAGLNPPAAIMA